MSKDRPLDGLPRDVFKRRFIGCAVVVALCFIVPFVLLLCWWFAVAIGLGRSL